MSLGGLQFDFFHAKGYILWVLGCYTMSFLSSSPNHIHDPQERTVGSWVFLRFGNSRSLAVSIIFSVFFFPTANTGMVWITLVFSLAPVWFHSQETFLFLFHLSLGMLGNESKFLHGEFQQLTFLETSYRSSFSTSGMRWSNPWKTRTWGVNPWFSSVNRRANYWRGIGNHRIWCFLFSSQILVSLLLRCNLLACSSFWTRELTAGLPRN